MMAGTAGFDPDHRWRELLEERHHLVTPELFAQNRDTGVIYPMKLKNVLRRIHSNSANLVHGRSPLFEINTRPHSGTLDAAGGRPHQQNLPFSGYIESRQSRASQGIPRFACNPNLNHAALSASQLLDRLDASICALNGEEAIGWTRAYCDNVSDRDRLAQRIAWSACKLGNDPHNQEIAQCMLMDFDTNQQPDRDQLLLAAAYHTAMHRKYGDPQEASRRFGRAMGLAELH